MCYCLDGSAAPPQPTRAARVDSSSRLPEKGSGLSVGQDRQRASTRATRRAAAALNCCAGPPLRLTALAAWPPGLS
jgi:hypothetical protein